MFKRLLKRTRLEVRTLTRTLHIPPVETEFYGGPQEGWLRNLLDCLPSLQALIVSRLSFFDHQSLAKVDHSTQEFYGLRLLVAANCENTTALSLASALFHFPTLVYLDLSSSQGARNPLVLKRIVSLENLQVLKLQNCGLRDADSEHLCFASSSSIKIRSLDLSHNHLSENGIYNIVHRLIPAGPLYERHGQEVPSSKSSLSGGQWSTKESTSKEIANMESFMSTGLAGKIEGQWFDESTSTFGLSYLYISDNDLTIDSVINILQHVYLQFLDCGSLNCSTRTDLSTSPASRKLSSNSIGRIGSNLLSQAFKNIKTLRIHHSIVTRELVTNPANSFEEPCLELQGEKLIFELDSTHIDSSDTYHELDSTSIDQPGTNTIAFWESPDDVGSDLLTNPSSNKITQYVISHMTLKPKKYPLHRVSAIPSPFPSGSETSHYKNHVPSPISAHTFQPQSNTREIISEVTQLRHRLESRERNPYRLKPSTLPNLKKLILTNVPTKTRNRQTIYTILLFLQECAEDEELARLEASLKPLDKNSATSKDLLKIQKIIFEISAHNEPEDLPPTGISPSRKLKSDLVTKSSTEDEDSERFMTARHISARRDRPSEGLIWDEMGTGYAGDESMTGKEAQIWDVVHEIKKCRRGRKESYDQAMESRIPIDVVAHLGHWRGEVGVVRME
ncbi:Leucine Rich Repeat domain protein [Sclerotinia borealis F-4128]|uniref:Leucine Rich Repeat domain protein n=1 Tax=Sclerotinia borealis (strain F-4128) TaxID=1432307 RepID=W9CKZ0_SCLBF|nr:Leucine Rich Repeat domain protein [Sclerotinia borealis F-4128]